MSPPPQFENTKGDEKHQYLTLFDDHVEGKGMLITLSSILRMRIEKREHY